MTLSAKGQITIPKAVVKQLRLKAGSELKVTRVTPTTATFTITNDSRELQFLRHLGEQL